MTEKKRHSSQQWFKHAKDTGVRDIRLEFTKHVKHYKSPLSTIAFDSDENQSENRYDDVVLFDQTRVKVEINPEGGKCLFNF